jgi:hypothetical protein
LSDPMYLYTRSVDVSAHLSAENDGRILTLMNLDANNGKASA